ncbi:MAG: hypothetical protein K6G24_12960 [Lachnospiraceae bacterium]|nr:hypothetical protein [Lachnospiraceae bacterium]
MQTDKIMVSANGTGWSEALEEAGKFSSYIGLDKKAGLRVRLLTEEALGMIEAIAGDFSAEYWIESDKKCKVRLYLKARTDMDFAKKRELIEASSDKKNKASKGFMGKIRQIVENALYSVDEVGALSAEYGGSSLMYGTMGMCDIDPAAPVNYMWSLENYKSSIENASDTDEAAKEAWDELEKSIVGSIADDVKVGVTGNNVEIIIEKKEF